MKFHLDSIVQIVSHKLEWKGESKVGSMDNATHKAGGGNVKVSPRLRQSHDNLIF